MPIPFSSSARGTLLLAMITFCVGAAPDAGAIVTRHDRDDEAYRALATQYPAALTVKPDGVCTLISPRFVLTAAHVAQGTLDRNPRVVVNGTEIEVVRAYFPPEWNGFGPHDIALMQLARPVTDLPPVALNRNLDEVGRILTFVGTGDTGTGETGPRAMDGVMRAATNRVDSHDENWIFFTFNKGEHATDLEGVSGPGDSGGPAFLEHEGQLFLAGVSSHSRNGEPGLYGTVEGYARVSSYAEWISAIVSGESDEPGVAPGESRAAVSELDGEKRAVTRAGGTMRSLADVDGGELITAYLDAYNSKDTAIMTRFFDAHFSEAYRARKTQNERLGYYHRLLTDHVGQAAALGVVEASKELVIVRIAGEMGREADFHFMLDEDGRIDDMMVAIIDGAPRRSH